MNLCKVNLSHPVTQRLISPRAILESGMPPFGSFWDPSMPGGMAKRVIKPSPLRQYHTMWFIKHGLMGDYTELFTQVCYGEYTIPSDLVVIKGILCIKTRHRHT